MTDVSKAMFPPGFVRRIDHNDEGLDDVAISDVKMFRLERMDNGAFWLCCYYEDGGRDVFWLTTKKRGKTKITGTHTDER